VRGETGKEDTREVPERAEGEDTAEPAFFAQGEDHTAARVEPADERAEHDGGDGRCGEDQQQIIDVGGGGVGLADLTDEQPP